MPPSSPTRRSWEIAVWLIGAAAVAAGPIGYVCWSIDDVEKNRDPLEWGQATFSNDPFLNDGRTTAEFSIPIRNISDQPVEFSSLVPSCGCSKLKPIPNPLPPFFVGQVEGELDPRSKDHQLQTIVKSTYSVRERQFHQQVPAVLVVRRPIESDSGCVELTGLDTPSAMFEFRQYARKSKAPFPSIVYATNGDRLRVVEVGDWKLLPDDQGFRVRQRSIRVESDLPQGGGEVLVQDSTSDASTSLVVPVSWKRERDVRAEPSTLAIYEGEGTRPGMSITSKSGKEVFLLSIDAPAFVEVKQAVSSSQKKGSISLELRVRDAFPARTIVHTITVALASDGKVENVPVSVLFVPKKQEVSK